jgi:hypothetical protein
MDTCAHSLATCDGWRCLTCASFHMQVVDVKGPSVLQMIKHMRSVENQAEFSHNSDYVPESLGKVCSAHHRVRGILWIHSSSQYSMMQS